MDNFLIVVYFILAVALGYGCFRLITKLNKQNETKNTSIYQR